MARRLGTEQGIRLSAMSPRYLQSNSTSHTRPFSAVAELLDNASDPGVTAKLLCIDVLEIKGEACLAFTDNGAGMTPHKLHHMLSFGFTDKAAKKNHPSIGVYGNGFKSGSMRLGKDAIVFTKNGGALSVGLLSQTYLECVHAQAVIVPLVPFSQQNKKMIVTEDSVPSLEAILKYTLFNTEEELLSQFDAIPGKKGTRILIWNIRRNKDGKPELDFDTDRFDIRISDFNTEEAENPGRKLLPPHLEKIQESSAPETEYSLRAYCSILYLKPRMQIVLRQKKVKTQLMAKSLAHIEYNVYKPTFVNKRVKITFGFNCKNKSHCGIMMYHNNRLIKSYEKVGCQMKGDGVGVIGVIECNFLKPAHNKQDFEENKEYRRTVTALGQKLNLYWKAKMARMNLGTSNASSMIAERPDQTWVQCEECLKWRKLPDKIDLSSLPEKWFCYLHPHPKYKSCSAPEEQELSDEEVNSSYDRKFGKQDQPSDRKQRKSSSLENLEHQVSSPASEPSPAENDCIISSVKQEPEEEASDGIAGSNTPPPALEKFSAAHWTTGPLKRNMLQTGGKHKLSVEEELLEKRRRYQEQVESFPPDLTSTSPPISSLQKVSTKAKQDDCYKSNIKEDVSVTENMCPCLSRDQQDVSSGTSHPGNLCSKDKSPAPDSPVAGVEEEMAVVQGDLEEQMPNLVAESQVAGGSVCVNMYGSMEEMGKRPFVAVVGISKTAAESGAPIQLIPLGREERLDRPKVEEKVLSSNDPPLEGDRDRGDLQELTTVDQKDTVKQQELRRAAENVSVVLKSVLAERDLLQCKVEKLEQEKCNLRADLLKSQQELASLRAQDTEGLYWSKKHMGYRQAELQELKAKLERTTEEKTELKERLRETEMHLEVLKEAHVSCRSPERGDSKSTMEKLKNLRLKVTRLLSLVLPHLELQDINFESDQVDEILQTVLETNHMSE